MTDRLVRTTPQQEQGHPSNKALEALRNYVATEAYIQSLEFDGSDDEGMGRLIKETRDQHLALIGKLTTAETHFYNEIKTVFDKNRGKEINEGEREGLKRSGFSDKQVQEFLRLFDNYHPKDSPSSPA